MEMYDEDDLMEIESEETEENGFVIDTAEKANWAIRKLKESRERTDIYIQTAKAEIERLQEKIKKAETKYHRENFHLTLMLDAFLDKVPAKETKTQISFELPNGKIIRKMAKKDFNPDKVKLLEFVKANAPSYVKIKEDVDWAGFKKELDIYEDKVIIKDTGEIVECVEVIEKPAVFDVKFAEMEG